MYKALAITWPYSDQKLAGLSGTGWIPTGVSSQLFNLFLSKGHVGNVFISQQPQPISCNHWSVYFDSGRCHCRNSLSWQRKRGRLIPLSTLFVWILAEWKLKTHHTWQALDRVCTGKWCLQNCQQKCNKPPIKCTAIYAWTLKLKLPCVSFSSNSNVFSRSSAWQMQADVIIVYNKVDSVTSSSLWS